MSAYGIEYLDDAMRNLGEMTDYAVNACGMDLEDFWKLFLTTGYAEKFGEGVPRVVSGFSGTELAEEVLRKAGKKDELPEPQVEFTCSREYWSGWILAYYQWYSEKKFKEIEAGLPIREARRIQRRGGGFIKPPFPVARCIILTLRFSDQPLKPVRSGSIKKS